MGVKNNYIEYDDGTYSATSIDCSLLEGNTLDKYMKDVEDGKVRGIGELKCYDKKGKLVIIKDLKSSKFE